MFFAQSDVTVKLPRQSILPLLLRGLAIQQVVDVAEVICGNAMFVGITMRASLECALPRANKTNNLQMVYMPA